MLTTPQDSTTFEAPREESPRFGCSGCKPTIAEPRFPRNWSRRRQIRRPGLSINPLFKGPVPAIPADWPRYRPNPALALWRMLAILTESFALLACYMALMIFRRGERAQYAHAIHWGRIWSRAVCRLIGLRVKVEGTPPVPGSLIVPNHTGYLDVLAVCSAAGCFFVPKSEVGGWPVIGSFIRLARHPLVKRAKSRAMKATADEITARLRCGQSVCVFLEGTSTGGDRVLPFQSSFIQPAIDSGSPIVPAAIRWIPSNPKISVSEDIAYWRDEHTFIPHLWRLLGVNRIEALIRFGEPISTQARERKGIATEARAETLRLLQPDPL